MDLEHDFAPTYEVVDGKQKTIRELKKAAKGAIDVMTIGLGREVASEGIRVNAVRPGLIDTEIHADSGVADRAKVLGATVPMKRPGTAEEVAEAIVWLLSDAASYTTSTILNVTGGR